MHEVLHHAYFDSRHGLMREDAIVRRIWSRLRCVQRTRVLVLY